MADVLGNGGAANGKGRPRRPLTGSTERACAPPGRLQRAEVIAVQTPNREAGKMWALQNLWVS